MLQKIREANQQKKKGISKPEERRKVKRKESNSIKRIKAISEAMLHSEGIAVATVEDMVCEMEDALSDMIWRWKMCKVTYPNIISSEKGREAIEDLKKEIVSFLQEIENGELWK